MYDQSMSPPEGDPVQATLKWFNPTKGFGFVNPDGEDYDAFLHVSHIQKLGYAELHEGAKILCHIEQNQRGYQVSHVADVLDPGKPGAGGGDRFGGGERRPRRDGGDRFSGGGERRPRREENTGPTETVDCEVKWFKGDKGYGFLAGNDGGPDIFLHQSVLERAGLRHVEPGQKFSAEVRATPKGREAAEVRQA